MEDVLKLAICQLDCIWENRAATRQRITELLKNVTAERDWFIFPETTLSGFSMNAATTTLTSEDHEFFARLARERNAFVTFGGVARERNCLWTLDRMGRVIKCYEKRHLFALGGERDAYLAGGGDSPVFKLEGWNVVPSICYDLRFTYSYWPYAQQADLLLNIACWPASRDLHWRTLLQARAIENQAYMVGVNRCGRDPRLSYAGSSLVIGPFGDVILDCRGDEGFFLCEIDRQNVFDVRQSFPFLRDRLT